MLRGDGDKQATASLKILSPLGAGGFGTVYEALDTRSGQRVAVKQLGDTSGDNIARFKHEFRALADCHHPNLVGLRELIEQDGRWMIVMELVPGTDFLRHVRQADNDNAQQEGACGYDEARLRTAMIGIAEGLGALHAYGILHRDLKPSNVRVRPDGRAVLLDFGLATSVDPSKQSTHGMGLGTAVYMAPEQASGTSLGPAVDMYALGVCLFEALTGRAPFEGNNAIKVLLDKQQLPAPRTRSFVPSIPRDLDELCAQLLAIDPSARPRPEQVLRILNFTPQARGSLPYSSALAEQSFAGRETELTHLERALALTHDGEQRIMLIEGESGIGKSELVTEFLRQASERHPKLIALRGRCYENEQLSYKAFDGCIDELSKLLRRMPEGECSALMPDRAALLGQLFPALRGVKAIAEAAREGSSADPTARRLEAFSALSRLFAKLAEERPLVLVLDDLQWADAESFRLLTALNQEIPRAPILLLVTLRPREELDPEIDARLEEIRLWKETKTLSLIGLPREQAKTLARKLLGAYASDQVLELIATESHGHPLFLSELVQYTKSRDFASRGSLTIDAALRARIDGLDRRARELLELVSLAARPYPTIVFSAALESNIDEPVRQLLVAKLLRQRKGHEIGCFHDRIRHASVNLIARTRLAALHNRLASALQGLPDADPSEQARHWDLAGQVERAIDAYEQAATKALGALAFTRAAGLFERALELLKGGDEERQLRLTTERADALAWAGRSGEAAQLYRLAADRAHGDTRLHLRSRAALNLVLSGKTVQGFEAFRHVLKDVGFSVPLRPLARILRFMWDASLLAYTPIDRPSKHKTPEEERIALDVASMALTVLAPLNLVAFTVISLQFVRRAVRYGSLVDFALATTSYAWFRSLRGAPKASARLLARARQLVESVADPEALAKHLQVSGSSKLAELDWAAAVDPLTQAQSLAQEHCQTNPWQVTCIRYHLGAAWYHSGDHKRLAAESERWLAEARERNDVLALCLLSGMGFGFSRHLLRNAPDAALDELAKYVAPIPAEPYSFPHLGALVGSVMTLMYRGGADALSYLDAYRIEHGHAFVLRTSTGKQVLCILEAYSLLCACAVAHVEERAALLTRAKRVLRPLRRASARYAQAVYALACAQIDALEGRHEDALAGARRAGDLFSELRHTSRRMAQYLEGVLEGPSGEAKRAAALKELRDGGWVDPLRAIGANVPLHALLAERTASASIARPTLVLDRYEVIGQIGRGGFGSVVSARDVQTGRVLALKELVSKKGTPLERFKQEFRALSDLHHDNIVRLEALFEHAGTWYIAMERVEGTDLVSYVRAAGEADPERLRKVMLGLTHALSALHQTGFVHRDVKPENVIVTPEGRAVLLDFGLIARVGDVRENKAVGSVDFAPPEQMSGAPPHPSADVYGLGTCLYAALSGVKPPLGVSQVERMLQKDLPLAPIQAPSGLEEVARLTALMLALDPELRPSLDEVAAVLGERTQARDVRGSTPQRAWFEESARETFSGRERELAQLRRAFEQTSEGGLRIAFIEGDSGLGKSALASDFAARARGRSPPLLVLRGRCYENEQVAFKAIDGAVDQLAQLLRELPPAACEAMLPKRAALLAQLFPVLSSVPAIAEAPKKGLPADPAARKQAGCEAFVQLLANVAAQRELLLILDDVQWADSESFDMLRAFARHGASLPLMVLCTMRPESEIEPDIQAELASLRARPGSELIQLGALDTAALTSLARQLLGTEIDDARLDELVRESNGHPLFLRELVAHERRGTGTKQALTLDGALEARIDSLNPSGRALLTAVALADKPHGMHVYARALALPELPRDVLVQLLSEGFLRSRGDKLSCYHDRIRRAAVARLSKEQRAAAARTLAAALSSNVSGPSGSARDDAAERARLWDEAGDSAQASTAYEQAADRALEALAFARAALHYTRALELATDAPHDARWQRLLTARGHALSRAGRSALAVESYQRAAERAQGEQKVLLRLWAAEQQLQSAEVAAGVAAASELLSELDVSLPQSERAAKKRIVWERACVKLRGIKLKERQCSAEESLRLDALHRLSAPLRNVAFLQGSALMVQYLRRALNAGEPRHAARALAYEALWRSISRDKQSQEGLFAHSLALAAKTGEPALIAEVEMMHGLALISIKQTQAAATLFSRAHDLIVSQCPGHPWLLTTARMYLGSAWLMTGAAANLRIYGGGWLDEAGARDDRYAIAALTGFGTISLRHALDGDPESGLSEIEAAMAPWQDKPFATTHLGEMLTTCNILASGHQPERFVRYVESQRERVAAAYVMRAPAPRAGWLAASAQAYLRRVVSPTHTDTARLIEQTRVPLRTYGRIPDTFTPGTLHFYDACFHLLAGNKGGALESIKRAHKIFHNRSLPYSLGIQNMLGLLEGGESGRALCADVEAQIRAEGWRDWQRGLAMRTPLDLELLEKLVRN